MLNSKHRCYTYLPEVDIAAYPAQQRKMDTTSLPSLRFLRILGFRTAGVSRLALDDFLLLRPLLAFAVTIAVFFRLLEYLFTGVFLLVSPLPQNPSRNHRHLLELNKVSEQASR